MKHNVFPILLATGLSLFQTAVFAADDAPVQPHPFHNDPHFVEHANGEQAPTLLSADIQWVSEPWYKEREDENAQMPYLTYLPEVDRVMMEVITHHPTHTAFIYSEDQGKTWGERQWFKKDENGKPQTGIVLGLTNLGGGHLLTHDDNVAHGLWRSDDYGTSWKHSNITDTADKRYVWDPWLVAKSADGKVTKLYEASYRPTGVAWGSPDGFYSQGYFRTSTDEGRTWTKELKVPEWLGVNEINLVRSANGDLVAACRTDYPSRYAHNKLDHFGGLAVSRSQDDGKTWSDLSQLYEWGRHHPSVVQMADGTLVMSYVVRLGYPATLHGYPQFGVEAIVSRDHGRTWDKDRRYVLAKWTGNIHGSSAWFCSVQSTSTVVMPDGTLITAFGTGFRNRQGAKVCKMDVALVRWQLETIDVHK